MNKLFTKIVGAALGLTMAIGVGVAVASSREAVPVYATDPSYTYTINSSSWGTTLSPADSTTVTWESLDDFYGYNVNGGQVQSSDTAIGVSSAAFTNLKSVTLTGTTNSKAGASVEVFYSAAKNGTYTSFGSATYGASATINSTFNMSNVTTAFLKVQITSTVSTAKNSYLKTIVVTCAESITPSVTFDDPTTEVVVGSTVTNAASGSNLGGASITYSSDDESVATVNSSGTVTGVAPGTATITASATVSNQEYSDSYDITVLAAPIYSGGMSAFDWSSYNNSNIYTDAALIDSTSISGKSFAWQASSFETYSNKTVFVLGDWSTTNGTWSNFSALANFSHIVLGLSQNSLSEASRTYALFSKNFGIVDLTKAQFSWTAVVGTGLTVSILASSDGGLTWSKLASKTTTEGDSINWTGSSYTGSTTVEVALVLTSTSTATGTTAPALRNITWQLYGASINESATYKATSVSITAASNNVVSGETLPLSSTIAPAFASDTVTYSVTAANPAGCATVNPNTGVVTGVAQGTATITATTSGGKTGTFNVNVGAARVYVTGVSITEGESASVALNRTLQLHAVVTPDNATTDTVTWSSGDESVATVDEDGLVTPVAQGTVSITATCDGKTEGGTNPSASISVTVGAAVYNNKASAVLTSGKQYKIVAPVKEGDDVTNYYLHSNGSSTQPTGTTNSWEATPFTFTLVGDDTWEITNGTDYLQFTGANNSYCRVTSGSDTWKLNNAADTTTYAGDWSIKSVNGSNRFLCLYNLDKFQGYTSESTNRTANIDFIPFDADEYAQDIVNATSEVCDGKYNHAKTDFTTAEEGETAIWTSLTNNYAFLSSENKALLVGATYERVESTVTATGTTTQTIADGVARHDYLVSKYKLDNILTGRVVPSLANSAMIGIMNSETANTSVIIVIVSLVGLTAIGGYFLIRRKEQQ